MIKLDSNTNIDFLEKSYSIIANKQEIDLKISKNVPGIEFGLMPAIIQFICTWYKKCQSSKIILDVSFTENIDTFDPEQLKDLSDKLLTDLYPNRKRGKCLRVSKLIEVK